MTTMSRISLACAALLALGLLTACGDDSSGGGASPTPEGTSSASPQLPGTGSQTPGTPGAPDAGSGSADDGPTVPLPTTTVTGAEAPYCQAALQAGMAADIQRSDERGGGNECVRTCSNRGWPSP